MHRIGPVTRKDIPRLADIVRASFPNPWPQEVFEKELVRKWARLFSIRDTKGEIIGFIHFWHVEDEVQILNIAVHPIAHKKGIASALMEHTLQYAQRHDCALMGLEVRASNKGAQKLYTKHKFKIVGMHKAYYDDNQEDALIMLRRLKEPTP